MAGCDRGIGTHGGGASQQPGYCSASDNCFRCFHTLPFVSLDDHWLPPRLRFIRGVTTRQHPLRFVSASAYKEEANPALIYSTISSRSLPKIVKISLGWYRWFTSRTMAKVSEASGLPAITTCLGVDRHASRVTSLWDREDDRRSWNRGSRILPPSSRSPPVLN